MCYRSLVLETFLVVPSADLVGGLPVCRAGSGSLSIIQKTQIGSFPRRRARPPAEDPIGREKGRPQLAYLPYSTPL